RTLELGEVLEASFGFGGVLLLEGLLVAALREHDAKDLCSRPLLGVFHQESHELPELPEALLRCRAEILGEVVELAQRFPHRDLMRRGIRLDALDGGISDTTCWRVDDAPKIDVAPRIDEHAQVGKRILDLGALVELGAANDLVGHVDSTKGLFEDT